VSALRLPSPAAGELSARAGLSELDALAARAREGDREAFERLVVATTPTCYQLAFRLVGNEHDARDVVQETYLRAYRGLKRFRGDAAVTTWLYRITVNCAARLLERRSRSATAILDESMDLADLRPERDPESVASASDERVRLVEALGELPDALRVVVVLRDVYDLPHREIARELGISQAAAKVRLHRARRLLRERIFPGRRSGPADGGGAPEQALAAGTSHTRAEDQKTPSAGSLDEEAS
jgi:RNA polymerase sigma-70 factor (ECF subfamily)